MVCSSGSSSCECNRQRSVKSRTCVSKATSFVSVFRLHGERSSNRFILRGGVELSTRAPAAPVTKYWCDAVAAHVKYPAYYRI